MYVRKDKKANKRLPSWAAATSEGNAEGKSAVDSQGAVPASTSSAPTMTAAAATAHRSMAAAAEGSKDLTAPPSLAAITREKLAGLRPLQGEGSETAAAPASKPGKQPGKGLTLPKGMTKSRFRAIQPKFVSHRMGRDIEPKEAAKARKATRHRVLSRFASAQSQLQELRAATVQEFGAFKRILDPPPSFTKRKRRKP